MCITLLHSISTIPSLEDIPLSAQYFSTTITSATRMDIDELVRMFEHLHQFNASLNEQFTLAEDWEQVLRQQLQSSHGEKHTAIWIARVSDIAAGFIMVEQRHGSPLFAQQHWAEISGIYVEPASRGSDVSHCLITHAYDWAAERGLDDIRLYVTANNDRARAFYQTEGFLHIQEVWTRPIGSEGET